MPAMVYFTIACVLCEAALIIYIIVRMWKR